MKIGLSCEFLGIKRNGTATYSRTLLRGLALLEDDHEYYPYLSSPGALALVPDAPRMQPRMVMPYNAYIRLALTLPLELLRRPVDLLHAQGWGPVWAPCPMVLTIHDIGWERFPEIYPRALAIRLSRQVRDSARRAAHIIASSHYTAEDLVSIYGIPRSKIDVIYPAMSPDIQRVEDAEQVAATLASYGISQPYILYVGSIEPKKNVHRLIEAYAALVRERNLPHTLVIAGRALWLSEAILQLPAQLGIAERVRFTGPVRQDDLAALYSGADMFAFLGMYEGFGYPPLEALACGAPVLAANRTSLPEVLGDAAVLVDPDDTAAVADGMARLLDDAHLRAALRSRGYARCAQFELTRHARQVAAIYAACAPRRGMAVRNRAE
jgi:glycosyltransferase involved in cell wall biosynthesis